MKAERRGIEKGGVQKGKGGEREREKTERERKGEEREQCQHITHTQTHKAVN